MQLILLFNVYVTIIVTICFVFWLILPQLNPSTYYRVNCIDRQIKLIINCANLIILSSLPSYQRLVCLGRSLVGYWKGYFNHKRCRRRFCNVSNFSLIALLLFFFSFFFVICFSFFPI